jgi:glycine hydroxymethyltransferase
MLKREADRQQNSIELIASENHTSRAVMMLQGSHLTNKYAEGYPDRRYYGGCEYVDQVESLAIDRACQLFGAAYANVQPHSGSQANQAVFLALLNRGDRILSLDLKDGGHLTHGSRVNWSGKDYDVMHYGVNQQGQLDYDVIRQKAITHQPKLIIAGYSAYTGSIDWQMFREIADEVGAFLLADMAHIAGMVAAGVMESPVSYADVVTCTTHKTLRGPRGGLILSRRSDLAKKLNSGIFPGTQGGPLMHVIAAKAMAFHLAALPSFKCYQQAVLDNSKTLYQSFMDLNVKLLGGMTHNHMVILDLKDKPLSGKYYEIQLDKANIATNKNMIPNDPRSPFETSGLRLGTAAVTSRGATKDCMQLIARWISMIIDHPNDLKVIQKVKQEVLTWCQQHPMDLGVH